MFDTQEIRAAAPSEAAGDLPMPAVTGSQSVHLLDRLSALFKHRRVAGTAFLLVVTAMMVQTYSTIPVYQTSTAIQIDDERSTSVSNLGVNDPTWWQESGPYYRTQYQILQSRELTRRVVRRLHLENNPDFNGNGPRPRDPITLVRQARASLSAWVRALVTRPTDDAQAPPVADETAQEAALVSAFLGGVQVRPVGDTRVVNIVYTHTNPQFAALAANTLAEEYTSQNLDLRLQNTGKTLEWVNAELEKATGKMKASEDALTRYREQNNAQSLDDRQNIVVSRLTSLNETVTAKRTERQQKETLFNQVKNADPASDSADAYPLIGNNPSVVQAQSGLAALKAERATLAQTYGPDAPKMKDVEARLDAATRLLVAERRRVIEAARNDYAAARAQEVSFAGDLERAKLDSMDLDRKSGDYKILQRDYDANQALFKSLLEQQKNLTVVANSRANNVRIMDRAEVPSAPIAPNPRRDWLTAVLAGLTIALGLAFGIEYLDDTVKTPEDVTRRLKLPLLGLVPAVRAHRVPVLTDAVPHDFGESFRSLRTSLVFTSGGEGTRIIAVTSSQPLEGKTTTAANMALALALGGSRVLLIDADMRRPGVHKSIGLANNAGLSNLLVGQSRVREVIQRTAEPNLFVITAGRTPPNPSELLTSQRMNAFLTNLAHGPFDWVLIDTPPVLAVTDAVIVAQKVAGLVFVIGSEMTRRVHAQRALETLQNGRARGIGVVLNRVDFDRNKYYYSRYYGYQYKSYYGQSTVA